MTIKIEDIQTQKVLTEQKTEIVAGGNNAIPFSTGASKGDIIFEPENYTLPYGKGFSRGYGEGYSRGYGEGFSRGYVERQNIKSDKQ